MLGPGDLHIIIHWRGQRLSILHPIPFKQLAERLSGSSRPRLERDIFSFESVQSHGLRKAGQFEGEFEASVRGRDWRETDIFRRSDIDIFREKKPAESGGKTGILSGQTETPNTAKRLRESCWFDQNQEMEKESLRTLIILSTKPRKQTSK